MAEAGTRFSRRKRKGENATSSCRKTGAIESGLQDLLSRRRMPGGGPSRARSLYGRADDEYARGNQRAEISGRLSHYENRWPTSRWCWRRWQHRYRASKN